MNMMQYTANTVLYWYKKHVEMLGTQITIPDVNIMFWKPS